MEPEIAPKHCQVWPPNNNDNTSQKNLPKESHLCPHSSLLVFLSLCLTMVSSASCGSRNWFFITIPQTPTCFTRYVLWAAGRIVSELTRSIWFHSLIPQFPKLAKRDLNSEPVVRREHCYWWPQNKTNTPQPKPLMRFFF